MSDGPVEAAADILAAAPSPAGRSSLALRNLRGLAILFLLAFHAMLAYLGFPQPSGLAFDAPPWDWRAFPFLDASRWFGFDLFCAWQDVYLMALMFFLSGLFAGPALARKGSRRFIRERAMRLGVPYLFGLAVVVPLALYPAYRARAADASVLAYARALFALPFWPNGPMWFLWLLLAFASAAAVLHRLAADRLAALGRFCARAAARPGRCLAALATIAALAYLPLALAFTPFRWADHGPFALQLSRPLLYAVYYFAGLGVGAAGLEHGLLATEGPLARRWRVWLAALLAGLLLWMGLTALTLPDAGSAPLVVQVGADVAFATAGASGVFFAIAICLRFAATRSRPLEALSADAFGIYLLHYAPLVWLQWTLLGLALPAVAKAAIVFAGTLLAAWAASLIIRPFGVGARLLGERPAARRARASNSRAPAEPQPASPASARRRDAQA
jgi:peptidoglycan/LPS O-acetylase OafA/YrhL